MSRFLILGTTLAVLARLAVAQATPSEIHYNLDNFRTYLLSPSGVDWQAARAYSRTLGGYLASINDSSEQLFINANYASHPSFWIGLSDAQTEGTFTWDSGQPVVRLHELVPGKSQTARARSTTTSGPFTLRPDSAGSACSGSP